jgi:hypothetical protein
MKFSKVYVTGRYDSQVNSIKNSILRDSNLNWIIAESPKEADLLLFFDYTNLAKMKTDSIKILIRQEPKLVLPVNYKKRKIRKFNKIIDVGKPSSHSIEVINWPQKLVSPDKDYSRILSSKAIMINSNLISLRKGEMYSLRREVAIKCDQVDLYGYGWNSNIILRIKASIIEIRKFVKQPYLIRFSRLKYFFKNQPNYCGIVGDKIIVMKKYRISVVIENSLSFVSEKLFHAFSGGCIPIYVGPDLVNFSIPKNLYIQAKPTFKSILKAMEMASEMDYAKWLVELDNWLKSEECYRNWSEETFLFRIKDLIEK